MKTRRTNLFANLTRHSKLNLRRLFQSNGIRAVVAVDQRTFDGAGSERRFRRARARAAVDDDRRLLNSVSVVHVNMKKFRWKRFRTNLADRRFGDFHVLGRAEKIVH